MKWKLIVLFAVGLLVVQSCDAFPFTPPPLPTAGGAATVVPAGETPVVGETALTGPTSELPGTGETPTAGPTGETSTTNVPVTLGNVSFVIPAGLGSGATPESMPAVGAEGAPWDIAPAHTKITLTGYPLQGKLFEPHLLIYPVADYEAAGHPSAAQVIDRIRVLLGEPDLPTNDEVPGVPLFNAAKVVGTQIARLNMQNGSGVRMVTEYAQGILPISNQDLIYQFQGLTSDGKYYIIANLPVSSTFLAADQNPASPIPPEGVPFPDLNTADASQINAYIQAVGEKLNAASPDSFQPPLGQLDALIQSIQVAP